MDLPAAQVHQSKPFGTEELGAGDGPDGPRRANPGHPAPLDCNLRGWMVPGACETRPGPRGPSGPSTASELLVLQVFPGDGPVSPGGPSRSPGSIRAHGPEVTWGRRRLPEASGVLSTGASDHHAAVSLPVPTRRGRAGGGVHASSHFFRVLSRNS